MAVQGSLHNSSKYLYDYDFPNTMSIKETWLGMLTDAKNPVIEGYTFDEHRDAWIKDMDDIKYFKPGSALELTKEELDMWRVQVDSPSYDEVSKPEHYMLFDGKKEVIDLIRDRLSPEELRGYLKGNMIKYLMRAGKKSDGELQDLSKLGQYVEMYKGEVSDG